MKCKHEGLPANASFCCWCGKKLSVDRTEVKVPAPKVLPSGTYFNQFMVKGERISISAATEKEYYSKARAAKLGLIEIKKAAPKMTLGAAIDSYIESNSNTLSPSTIRVYKTYRQNRFQAVMNKDINSIQNWQKIVNDEFDGISAKTLANGWRLITASLKAQNVPVPEVTLPKSAKAERPWLDFEQINTFLAAIEGKDCELAALLALHGLRRSEILALTADKIDTKKGTITVSGSMVVNDKGELIEKETNKTKASQRTVHIVIPRLETLLKDVTGNGLLITVHHNTIRKQINAICEKNDLPLVGVHGLRHSFASLAYHLGWSELTVMQEGGWSNTQTVHNIYTHLAAQDKNDDIDRMKAFYDNANKSETVIVITQPIPDRAKIITNEITNN